MLRSILAHTLPRPRLLAACGAAALALAASAPAARAVFTFTLQQVANNVTVTGSGTLNLTGLTLAATGGSTPAFKASTDYIVLGSTTNVDFYNVSLSGPANLGPGTSYFTPSTNTGNEIGPRGTNQFVVPAGYTSGSALSNTATFTGQTFATIGFTPGTYTYTLANGDSFVVTSVVPEPSTWALLGLGVVGLGVTLRQRRRARLA